VLALAEPGAGDLRPDRDSAQGGAGEGGRLDELISIENQTEIILEGASPEVLEEVRGLLAKSGARVLAERKPQTTLERFFS